MACDTDRQKFEPPVFERIVTVKHTVIQDTLYITNPEFLISFDNYIIILNRVDNKFLQVFDKQTGEHLGGYVAVGQGPGEMNECMQVEYNKQGRTVTLYDSNSQQYFIYTIHEDSENFLQFDSKKNFADKNSINQTMRRIMRIYRMDEIHCLFDSRTIPANKNDQRFSLVTESGDVISEYRDFATTSFDDYWAYSASHISISPDKRKMVSATYYGGVLEIFAIDNSIKLIKAKYFYPIFYKDLKYTEETYWVFQNICTSDEYIFTLLLGSKDIEAYKKLNHISVFNWQGEPVVRFTLEDDLMLLRLCYNEDDGAIYAVAWTQDYDYVLLKLEVSNYL